MGLDDYNGWTNYETWCVALWLGNDQGTDEIAREIVWAAVQDSGSIHPAADVLESFVKDLEPAGSVLSGASFASDLLGASLARVNWLEIAEAFKPEADA